MKEDLFMNQDPYRLQFHLMPPKGWLNDPNGLCQLDGKYHIFFQYAPDSAEGKSDKYWGHYESTDLLNWTYTGIAISPDQEIDRNGAYSGSALVENGEMNLYYTGNVKLPGDYDYTYAGRLSNTILVQSKDGIHFTEKQVVVDNSQYPEKYSCHIRDPKVWKHYDTYYMILGARTRDDHGAVILYSSKDKIHWNFLKEITTKEKFGYMWECPDLFMVSGKCVLSISPQGLDREEYKNQNIYQSGYFIINHGIEEIFDAETEITNLSEFIEWDMGFDFYAPQTFRDEYGRRLLIGWAGLPDVDEEYTNPTVASGWQHALTIPRELSVIQIEDEEGNNSVMKVFQSPVSELKELRGKQYQPVVMQDPSGFIITSVTTEGGAYEIKINDLCCNPISVQISEEVFLTYEDGIFELRFAEDGNTAGGGAESGSGTGSGSGSGSEEDGARDCTAGVSTVESGIAGVHTAGAGRTVRRALVPDLFDIRILADTSLLEIYLNDGEVVFTTRYYPASPQAKVNILSLEGSVEAWQLNQMTFANAE